MNKCCEKCLESCEVCDSHCSNPNCECHKVLGVGSERVLAGSDPKDCLEKLGTIKPDPQPSWEKKCCKKCYSNYTEKDYPSHVTLDACINASCECHRIWEELTDSVTGGKSEALFLSDKCECQIHSTYGFVPEADCEEHDTKRFFKFLEEYVKLSRQELKEKLRSMRKSPDAPDDHLIDECNGYNLALQDVEDLL